VDKSNKKVDELSASSKKVQDENKKLSDEISALKKQLSDTQKRASDDSAIKKVTSEKDQLAKKVTEFETKSVSIPFQFFGFLSSNFCCWPG